MAELGRLKHLPLRTYWKNETRDFTPWLAEHSDELGDVVGMDLEVVDTEVAVGRYSVDILANDTGAKRKVVIENQLERTDHEHLGKLLTYAAGLDADVVIWVAASFNEEHRAAFEWLNRNSQEGVDFIAVQVELLQIDDSKPAPKFEMVVAPLGWAIKKNQRPASERAEKYRSFFQKLIDTLREKHSFTRARIGQAQSWYNFPSGIGGLPFAASFASGGRACVQVYIDLGDGFMNLAVLNYLRDIPEIENELGHKLDWEELPSSRACRIAVYKDGSMDSSESELESIHDWMVERLLKFNETFSSRLPAAVDHAVASSDAWRPEDE